MRRYISELIGSFIFILIGCGSRVFGGNQFGVLAEAIAFVFTFIAKVYAIGNISGGHINPAVSLAMYMTNKLSLRDFFYYILSQFIGGILAIAILVSMINLSGEIETVKQIGLAQNGYAEASSIGIYIIDIPLTGGGINPARSLAPAVFLGGTALRQVWLFIIAPFAGAAGASVFWNFITKELTL